MRTAQEHRIIAYVREHAGQQVSVAEVCEALSLPGSTVSGALSRVVARGHYPELHHPRRGMWVWGKDRAPGRAAPRKPIAIGTLLECVGRTSDGDAVIRDEAGEVYTVRPI